MLRLFTNPRLLGALAEGPKTYQTVRWRRKPLWMGTAKSKLFKVPARPVIPDEELQELRRLYNNYRTVIKSLRRVLTYKHSVLLQAKSDTEQLTRAFQEDFARCNEINEKWNEELRIKREERVARDLEAEKEFAKNRMAQLLREKEEELAEAEEMVRRQKEMVGTFITPENLDEAIERAIANPVDYNFAIDLEGNRIFGRETKPEAVNVKLKQ